MIECYIWDVSRILTDNLLSVVIYGSVALNDFTHGKGDIDFVTITRDDLSSSDCRSLIDLHVRLREGKLGQLGTQLEGIYCPLAMLTAPHHYIGEGCYIGTSQKGWREIVSSPLALTDLVLLRRYGLTMYGEDVRAGFFEPTLEELRKASLRALEDNLKQAQHINDLHYGLHLVYLCTRALYTYLTGNILSKSGACEWFVTKCQQSEWVPFVQYAAKYRYPLTALEQQEVNAGYIMDNAPLFLSEVYEMMQACK